MFDGTATSVFVRGTDLAIYGQSFTSATANPGWAILGGGSASNPEAVFDGSSVRVVVRGTDNGLYWRKASSGGWAQLSGVADNDPAVAPVK